MVKFNMDMPKHCVNCMFYEYGYCYISDKYFEGDDSEDFIMTVNDDKEYRPMWCELEEVKE